MWRSGVVALVLSGLAAAGADAAREPWDPVTKLRSRDQAKAAATVLTQADLGAAWAGGPRKPTSLKAPTCPAQRPNAGDLTITGHAESVLNNGNGGIQISSDVEVFASKKQAKARFVRFMQPKLVTCLKYDLAKSVGGSGFTFLKATRLDFPQVAERTALFRIPIAVKSGSQTVTVDADFLFLGAGRSQIYVNVVAPSVQESQLRGFELMVAKLLVKRAPA